VRPTDALEYAAAAGTRQRGLTPEEVKEDIIRRYGYGTRNRGHEAGSNSASGEGDNESG